MGNFKDSKLQTLAKRGNGNYAYLDDLHEAEKVLVQELTETLYAVADNAFINVQFNPSRVNSYRLIGFDNKRDAVQDGTSDLDGGEIGSGSSNMAIFELIPVLNNNVLSTSDIGKLQLKFHDIKDKTQTLQQTDFVIQGQVKDSTDNGVKFGAAVAMYGLKLKESIYLNKATWADVKAVAESAADKTVFLQTEFLKLLDKTIEIYDSGKKKKKKKKVEG
jgi:Ca-activated chloride channel homolog